MKQHGIKPRGAERKSNVPDWKPEIRRRLANLKLEPTREASVVDELAQHLEDCYAELLAGGATPAEAERQTRAELSGSELLQRELRREERQVPQEPIVLGTNRRTNMIGDVDGGWKRSVQHNHAGRDVAPRLKRRNDRCSGDESLCRRR